MSFLKLQNLNATAKCITANLKAYVWKATAKSSSILRVSSC